MKLYAEIGERHWGLEEKSCFKELRITFLFYGKSYIG